jgi:hypothetical protein
LGNYGQWESTALDPDGCLSESPPIEDTDTALVEQTTPEPFSGAEAFGMFSAASSAGDLDSLFPLDSTIDATEATGDATMINLFSYD